VRNARSHIPHSRCTVVTSRDDRLVTAESCLFSGNNSFCGILNLEVTGSELNSKLRLSEMKLDKI
jgi:hypothetical protein